MEHLIGKVQPILYTACFLGVGWSIVKMVWKGSVKTGVKDIGIYMLLLFFLKYPSFIDSLLLAAKGALEYLLEDISKK